MSAPGGQAIVILDDEKSYVDLLSSTLAERFHNPVVTFTRPFEALSALPSIDAGIIITDYYMPQLNGVDFILQARELKPGVPFIIITGHGGHFNTDDFPQIPELKRVIHKPFGWRALAEEISRAWPGATEVAFSQTRSERSG